MKAGAIVVFLAIMAFWGLVPYGRGQTNYQQIKSFGGSPGQSPDSPLIEGTDGVLYGTCISSDGPGYGKIFRINKDGSGFGVLKTFAGSPEGRNPRAGLLEGSDGALYGTTYRGGTNDYGSVFKIQKDGSGFETLHSFSLAPGDGIFPFASLIEASDGLLYGTTYQGGGYNQGTIFKLNKNGSGYSIVHHLSTPANEGGRPLFGVHEGTDGALYGCAPAGGTNGYGTVFKLNKNGTGFTLLHTFRSSSFGDGSSPTDVTEGSDGTLYGTTSYGGTNSTLHYGTVFRLNKDGTGFAVLYSFANGTNASAPQAGLIEGMDGALYGTALVGGLYNTGGLSSGAVFKLNKDGTGFSVVKYLTGSSFNGDAYSPVAPLIQGTNGMLYGTTRFGGTDDVGALFKLSTSGAGYQVMFSFKNGEPCGPYAGLVEGPDGMLYGTTFYSGGGEYGTVFKVNKDGSGLTILHRFGNPDARYPVSGLVFGTNGMIYGAGAYGGTNEYGAIFTLDTNGLNYSVLHVFGGNATDGGWPYGTLMSASDGVLYGTTELVGPGGAGTVFSFHTDGSAYTVLHNFTGAFGASLDGGAPYAGLFEASNGQLYGTTAVGGSDAGTVYTLNKDGSDYSILYNFSGANGDGGTPRAALIEGSDGRLYGTTERGGLANIVPTGAGTIFRINQDGTGYEVVYRFTGGADGSSPYGGLSEGLAGALYGTTFSGGANNGGTVFKIGKDGNGFTVLHDLIGVTRDGFNPYGGLLRASDGGYYGTTFAGGETNLGTLFRLYSTQGGVSIGNVQPVSEGARVGVRGAAWAQSLELQTSTNVNGFWVGIATNAAAVDGTCEFLDFAATNSPIRFYRTRTL